MNDLISNLSQAERLNLCAGSIIIPPDSIGRDERSVISMPPNGFRMPSMSRVREHDARLQAFGSECNVQEDTSEDEEDMSEDMELRDYAADKRRDQRREFVSRLPSMGSRADVRDSLSFMGMAWGE